MPLKLLVELEDLKRSMPKKLHCSVACLSFSIEWRKCMDSTNRTLSRNS